MRLDYLVFHVEVMAGNLIGAPPVLFDTNILFGDLHTSTLMRNVIL